MSIGRNREFMKHILILLFMLLPLITEAQESVEIHSDLFSKKRDLSIKINGERVVKTPAEITFEVDRSYNIELEDSSNKTVSDFEFKILKFSDSVNPPAPSWYRKPQSLKNKYPEYNQVYGSYGKSRSVEISFNKGLDKAKNKAGIDNEREGELNLLNMEVHEIGNYYSVYLLWGK